LPSRLRCSACGGHTAAPGGQYTGYPLEEARDARLAFASQVLDPAAGVLYALVPATLASPSAPDVLQAIDLRTGRVRRGESYRAYGLALASGLLWVSGYSGLAQSGGAMLKGSVGGASLTITPSRDCWG
jgi:hypothetical protein